MTGHLWKVLIVSALMPAQMVLAQTGTKSTGGGTKSASKSGGAESLHDKFTGQGYGVAGCGLGSVVFGPKPGKIQIIAATLNGLWGTQTFGITSGTSNCEIPEMGHQAAAFIEVNREILAKEAARGKGETVAGLAYILKCDNPTVFGQHLQENFEEIFAQESSYDTTRAILGSIQSNQALAAVCNKG